MVRWATFAGSLLLGAFLTIEAAADDPKTCELESGDIAIEACNRVINSGRYSGNQLSDAYMNRSAEWLAKGDNDRALKDANAAIKLNPKSTHAFTNRGVALEGKGDLDRAIADYTQAIQLDRDNPGSYVNRGEAKEKRGDIKGAVADFKAALTTHPKPGKFVDNEKFYNKARERLKALAAE